MALKGHIPWNKGKTKEEFPQLSNSGVKKGTVSWNTGKKGVGRFGDHRISREMQQEKILKPLENATNECIEWQGAKHRNGYGLVRIDGIGFKVHRAVWTLVKGEIPKGMHVLHTCDNPPCFNIKHLFLGTHLDNMRDRKAKGRYPTKKVEKGISV